MRTANNPGAVAFRHAVRRSVVAVCSTVISTPRSGISEDAVVEIVVW